MPLLRYSFFNGVLLGRGPKSAQALQVNAGIPQDSHLRTDGHHLCAQKPSAQINQEALNELNIHHLKQIE